MLPWLDPIADAVAPVVRRVLSLGGVPLRNALHGTWLGHPLHPALTDVPTGAWTVSAMLDALELAGVRQFVAGSDAAVAIGIAGGAAAGTTGWADWADTANEPKRLGLAHAMLNGAALAAYTASFVSRMRGRRKLGIALAMAGYGAMSFAAYLGGELSLGMQIGTRHTASPIFPEPDFVPVLDADALADGTMKRVDLGGIPVLVSRSGDTFHAIGNACTHRGAPLDEGTREANCVRCPWHASLFSLVDGRAIEAPATFPQPRFDARVRDGRIELRPTAVAS